VPVPVVTVTRREGGAVAMRAGTVLQICPEAPNHAFFLATGARPAIQLDMEGDDEFEVVLRGAQNAQLDRARSRATVRIVSAAEMAALEQQAEAMGAAAAVDKEEAEALAAEVAASKERAEAEEAKRRWLAEEAESKEAEAALEAAYVAQHAAEKLVADKEAEASAAERQIDAWRARAAQAGARRKELFPGFAPLEHAAQRLHKVPPPPSLLVLSGHAASLTPY
jgi:chromosome segregation ATPase